MVPSGGIGSIFQDGNQGQQVASEAATYYSGLFDSVRLSVKRGHFLAKPTIYYMMFRNSGFGFLNAAGGKWRGLQNNQLPSYS